VGVVPLVDPINGGALSTTAVCLLGQPTAVEYALPTLRAELDAWDADAFVFASASSEREPNATEAEALRGRVGPRLVEFNLSSSVPELYREQATGWYSKWVTRGHPVEQWVARLLCHDAVVCHEASRGATYEFYIRLRLDIMLFRSIPTDFQVSLRRSPCTVIIPTLENWHGINDRILLADQCGFRVDAQLFEFMSTVGDRHHDEKWNPEMAEKANLFRSAVTVLREPILHCILREDNSCSITSWQSLTMSSHLMPNLVQMHPHLCGNLRYATSPCDERRKRFEYVKDGIWGHQKVLPGFGGDPGFCKLQERCKNTSAIPSKDVAEELATRSTQALLP